MTLELDFPLELPPDSDKPKDHCAVVGVIGHDHAAQIAYYCLHALQHRGQEASGIVTSYFDPRAKRGRFNAHKDFGLVADVFKDEKILEQRLLGSAAIGHNRYSTAGSAYNKFNIQPLIVNYKSGNAALSHNGNLTNFHQLRSKLQDEGTIFQTTSDSELFLHLMAKSKKGDQVEQVLDALGQVEGAFSVCILTDNYLIAARDPFGWRPLAIGLLGESYVVASETCAFDIVDAKYIRDVEPGEVVVFSRDVATGAVNLASHKLARANSTPHHCIFEYIYFSRPDSFIFGDSVDRVRRRFGKALAREHPVAPDKSPDKPDAKVIVINVPDSSNTATIGFATENSKLGNNSKYEIGLIRSHYVGRTFIQPMQDMREIGVKAKFNTVKGVLKDKKVVIVDDSIVRGTTSKQLVKLIRAAGAKEIHFRVTSPPIKFPCHYGIDFPDPQELIANKCGGEVEEIRKELGVDSLEYLSLEKLEESVPKDKHQSYCTACFSGKYPTAVNGNQAKEAYEA